EGSNIQDNCTLHCDFKMPLVIGKNVTVGHNAVLHSCIIGDGTLIGMGSIILNGAEIGKGCIIAAGSLVTTGSKVPDGTLFMGSPATFKRALSDIEQTYLLKNAEAYIDLIRKYKNQ
ncbi:MAG TPA: gamma carbonic anhydrase family protein, partial [Ruminiclostridium sp.]|nr:gamma carbonic anhydrase family protein [Ruminiclostridium sp.]